MSAVAERTIFTIGHSNHAPERFAELLAMHGVTMVADVRSAPYSRRYPNFNRDALCQMLERQGIAYLFLGNELGARSRDPSCYEDGRVQYCRLAQTAAFKRGLERVLREAQSNQVTLLCAEKEPLACHRTLLVARELDALGAPVAHIHADGSLESHPAALDRLLRLLKMPAFDLFRTREELRDEAYARQEQRIAYVDEDMRATTDEEA
jgi:uncharacterized protein (DUF488 family)